jgi:hypothetical protein
MLPIFLLALFTGFALPTHGATSPTMMLHRLSNSSSCLHNVSGVGVLDFSSVNNTAFHVSKVDHLCGGDGTNTYDFYVTLCGEMTVGTPDLDPICRGSVACQVWGQGAGSSASVGLVSEMKVMQEHCRHKKELSVTAVGGTDYREFVLDIRCPSKRHRAEPRPCYFGEVVAENMFIFEWVTPLGCPKE